MAYLVSGKFSDGGSWTASAPSNSGNQLVTVVADENISTSDRTTSLLVKNASGGICTVSVAQEKAVYTYDFTLNASASMLGAEGGTTKVRGTLVTYRSGIQVSSETVVPTLSGSADGFSISGDVVTAADRGTTAGLVRRITVTGTYSATFDGQEVSATVVISQAANGITRVQISTGDGTSPITSFSAAGRSNWWYYAYGTYTSGSSARIPDSYSGWSLESVSWASIAPAAGAAYAASFSCDSRGFEVGDTRTVELSFTYDGKSDSITITQAANVIESVKIYSSAGGAAFDGSFPASGGHHFATCRATYSSAYVGELQDASQVVWSISGTGFSWEPSASYPWAGVVIASDRGIVVGSALSGVLTLTVGALTDSADLTQAENKIESYTYGAWGISISADPTTIGYGGGSSTISASCSRSKTPVYSSGSSGIVETESVTPSLSGSASGFTLSGTTVTAAENQSLDKRSITVTASYSGATSQSVVITQDGIPVYVYVGADQASAVSKKYTITMPMGGSKEAIYFKVSGGSQLVTSDSNAFLVGAAEGIEDAYIASNDLFTLEKPS